MTMPHANDTPRLATRGPDQYNHSCIKPAGRDELRLRVVESIIYARQVQPRKDFLGSTYVETALLQCALTFLAAEGDTQVLNVATVIAPVNPRPTNATAG